MNDKLLEATKLLESERSQIGHEIHDALLPLIFGANAGLQSVIDETGDERLIQVSTLLAEAMKVGRDMLAQIYSPDLEITQWTVLARDLIGQLKPGSEQWLEWNVDPEINRIEPHAAFAAYRIVVEAVRNALRHGNAQQVSITTQQDKGEWEITISDSGTGFDVAHVPTDRFGLKTMRGRAALVGGTLEIQSRIGGPTVVTLRIPA